MAPHFESDLQLGDTVNANGHQHVQSNFASKWSETSHRVRKRSKDVSTAGSGHVEVTDERSCDPSSNKSPEPLAIVGLAFQFPGGAVTEDKFWDLLTDQKNVSSDFPKERININAFHSEDPKKRATVSVP